MDERGVNGDSAAAARYRSGNSVQPEREANARSSLPLLSDGAETLGRSRGAKPFQRQRGG